MTSTEARKFLADQGYFTDNLWHVKDVTMFYKCSEEKAYNILDKALGNGHVMETISESIDMCAQDLNLEKL